MLSGYRLTEDEFKRKFDELCEASGVNPAHKSSQARAWYSRYSKRPAEVLEGALRLAGVSTRYVFPTLSEFASSVRRVEAQKKLTEEHELSSQCATCGGTGLVRMGSPDTQVMCDQDDALLGYCYFSRCGCGAGGQVSSQIPPYVKGMVDSILTQPRHGSFGESLSIEEALVFLNSLTKGGGESGK